MVLLVVRWFLKSFLLLSFVTTKTSRVSERTLMNMKVDEELMRLRKDNENAIARAQIESTNVISRLAAQNRVQKEDEIDYL